MTQKLSVCLFLFFLFQTTQSIGQTIWLKGAVKNTSLKGIKNSHILNLTTKKGTVSNENGHFEIKVKKGDWLQVTNVQYKNAMFRITNTVVKEKTVQVFLFDITNQLEEVKIKKKMKGFLSLDRKEKTKDTLSKTDKDFYNFSKMDFTEIDKAIKKVKNKEERNSAIQNTDPTRKFAPVTIASVGIPDGSSLRKKALRKELNYRKSFPGKLKVELGEVFFFQKLKIPKEKYHHFLEYCNPLGIEQLYKNRKILKLIELLQEQSKSYLQIINKK
jgi:hypothetical protein